MIPTASLFEIQAQANKFQHAVDTEADAGTDCSRSAAMLPTQYAQARLPIRLPQTSKEYRIACGNHRASRLSSELQAAMCHVDGLDGQPRAKQKSQSVVDPR